MKAKAKRKSKVALLASATKALRTRKLLPPDVDLEIGMHVTVEGDYDSMCSGFVADVVVGGDGPSLKIAFEEATSCARGYFYEFFGRRVKKKHGHDTIFCWDVDLKYISSIDLDYQFDVVSMLTHPNHEIRKIAQSRYKKEKEDA